MKQQIMILILALFSSGLISQTAIAPASGDGSTANPYEIATLENLYWIAASDDVVPDPEQSVRWMSNYVQTANINAAETIDWFTGEGWSPIGDNRHNNPVTRFRGTYDGQYNTIDSLYINRPNTDHIGLFGVISGAAIENLGLTDINITGFENVGGLMSVIHGMNSLVDNCFTTGTINGYNNVGGIAGKNSNGTISSSYSLAEVSGNDNVGGLTGNQESNSLIFTSYSSNIVNGNDFVGGITGRQDGAEIIACHSTGSVTGARHVGGLVGWNNDSLITNSHNLADVTGNGNVGGLVGTSRGGSVTEYSFSTGLVTGGYPIGGLVGEFWYQSEIDNCYSLSQVNDLGGNHHIGGLIGLMFQSTVSNSYYNYEVVTLAGEHLITIGALPDQLFVDWLDNDLALDIDDHLTKEGDDYLIDSVQDLNKLLYFGQHPGLQFLLNADLDLAAHPNFYIPYFAGFFDGDGHQIANMSLEMSRFNNLGMFGYLLGGTIKNLGLSDVFVSGRDHIGGLAGDIVDSAGVDNCFVSGSISGDYASGGLVGYCEMSSSVTSSSSSANVSGNDTTGGLIGGLQDNSEVRSSFSTGDVESWGTVGGLIGWVGGNSSVENCFARGSVTGAWRVGGLIGNLGYDSEVNRTYSTGQVDYTEEGGGLLGYAIDSSDVGLSYWDTETSGRDYSHGGEGRTTSEMTFPHAANSYEDWDFAEIWIADEEYLINHGYPYLIETEHQVSVEDDLITTAGSFELANFPNPFNPETTIAFTLSEDVESLELQIYNIRGQLVRTLIPESPHHKGNYQIIWDGRNEHGRSVTSGVYYYHLKTEGESSANKMLLLK